MHGFVTRGQIGPRVALWLIKSCEEDVQTCITIVHSETFKLQAAAQCEDHNMRSTL